MWNWLMLSAESSHVITLRIAKLMRGGKLAEREAQRMITEKMVAVTKANNNLMTGASPNKIVRQLRTTVRANAKRLSRTRTRRKRKHSG